MKIKFLIIICIAFFSATANAQTTFHSLQEVLDFADTHTIAIKSSESREALLALRTKESKANLLPSFNTYAGYNDNIVLQPSLIPSQILNPSAPEGSLSEVTFGTKYNYYIGGKVQWDVLNFQKLFAVKTADAEWQLGKQNTALYKMNTYNTLANTYYSILLTEEALTIYKENLSVADTIYANAQNKYQKGIISEADLNLAEIKKLQAESTLQNAQSNLAQLYVQFQSQLNISDAINIEDNINSFKYDIQSNTSNHPEVLLKEAEIKKQETIIKQTQALRYPSLSLSYQNTGTWATDDFFNFSNANQLPNQVFGATLSLPLFTFSTKQKIKQSELELSIKQSELENTKLVKQKEDELLGLKLNQATEQLRQNEKILQLQKTNDTHAENKYKKDVIALDERLKQYEDLLIAQDGYLQSLGALTITQYQLYIRKLNYE